MVATNGRDFLIVKGGTTVGGATAGSISVNNEPIDVTNKDSSGWRELLAAGKRSADVTLSGVNLDDATIADMRTDMLAQTADTWTVVIPGLAGGSAGTYSMTGIMTSLEESGEEGGATTYSLTIQSSGAVTFTDLT